LNAERRPLEATEFKHLVEKVATESCSKRRSNTSGTWPTSDIWNFNRAVLNSLLPQAMSFTNLKSFDDFAAASFARR